MKICFNEGTTLRSSNFEDDVKFADEVGFDYMEPWICQIDKYMETHTMEDLGKIFEGRHIKPYALDSFEDTLFNDNYEQLKKDFIKACEYGKVLNADKIVMVPTFRDGINDEYTKEEIDEEAVRVLTDLGTVGAKYGMKLGFEPIGFGYCSVRSIAHAWEIVQKVNMDNVGLTLDVFNNYLFNGLKDIDDIRRLNPKKIFIFHIDDAKILPLDQYNTDQRDRVCPGEGDLPCAEYIKVLKEIGFDEEASIELFNPEMDAMSPKDAIQRCYNSVAALIKEIEQ